MQRPGARQARSGALWRACTALVLGPGALFGCASGDAGIATAAEPPPAASTAMAAHAAPAGSDAPAASGAVAVGDEPAACRARSRIAGEADRLEAEAFARCRAPGSIPPRAAAGDPRPPGQRCGEGPEPRLDLAALEAGVLPLDAVTAAHVRAVVTRGRSLGRRVRVFALVGDSMTVSGAFLPPRSLVLAPEVEQALRIPGRAGTSVEFFRGAQAEQVRGVWVDSFAAERAARVGARAPFALAGGAGSPLARVVDRLSPSVAVVLFGGNDAAYRMAEPVEIAGDFGRDLERIVDFLEERGVVPVLDTLARHGDAPGVPGCGKAESLGDARIAMQTSALDARVTEIACRRALPLIDVRAALDALPGRGLGPDGIHPSVFADGPEYLDARGLQCGYNVRSYLTLATLARLVPLLEGPGPSD